MIKINGFHLRKILCFFIVFSFVFLEMPAFASEKTSSESNIDKVENVNKDKSRAEYLGMKLFKGHLHTHTSISDGIKMPNDAYEYVKQNTDLDFYAVTEHDVTYDISTGSDYITDYKDSYSEEYKVLHEQSNEHNKNNKFVAIPGVEITWYDGTGHINLFNTEWFPRTYGKGATGRFGWGNLKYDLPTFYARVAQDPGALAQFNHPSASGAKSFNDFKHFNKDVDKNLNLIAYKYADHFDAYVNALDKGWHLSPTFGGDEHKGGWGTVQPNVTGLWTDDFSREGVYDAIRNHRTYSSHDRNFELAFSSNEQIMGSILPAETKQITIDIALKDPDKEDPIDKVTIHKNNGEVVEEYTNINSNEFTIEETFPSSEGDYFFVRIFQTDEDEAVSAPIWIGEETRGTDASPEIDIKGDIPDKVTLGESVEIPEATALDDSGEAPEVKITVFDSKGTTDIENNRFTVEEYGEYFIKYAATDSIGNTRVELKRIVVDNKHLDAEKILNEFQPIAGVGVQGSKPNGKVGMKNEEVGINLVTDNVLEDSYVQYKPASSKNSEKWNNAKKVKSKVSYFEAAYGDTFDDSNYRVLAAHEANLTGLKKGTTYQYRYGLSPSGPWGSVYTFETAPDSDKSVMYLMGDLEAQGEKQKGFNAFNNMLDVLKQKNPNGQLMMQIGDLVDNGGNIAQWTDIFDNIYKDLDLLSANVVGDHERQTDTKLGSFSGFFNHPKNGEGSYAETNYSFDYGNIHIAVLNSLHQIDEQLDWLQDDMRSTNKKWKVVIEHYPYYGGGHSDEPGMEVGRIKISKRLQQLGVNLHVGGHDHVYKRTTIRDGVMNNSEEAMNLGTTFVTLGSSGLVFDDNKEFDWDHIVYDENKQTGIVLEEDQTSLTLKAYNSKGETVDEFTVEQPREYIDLTSFDVEDSKFTGIGLLNYPGTQDKVTVVGEKYDYTGTKLLETKVKEVNLEHLGREQMIYFDKPIEFEDQNTIKVSVFDNLKDQNPVVPSAAVREGIRGDGTSENPYRIQSVGGLKKVSDFPDKHFVLEKDIVGDRDLITPIGAGDQTFTGTFDGNGHTITGVFVSSGGAGIFDVNDGVIKNIGIVDAKVDVDRSQVGILVNKNNGVIENAYTSGSIAGNSTVGGMVGYSNGTIRNSYSTARVKARVKQAGGLVGITNRGSLTENVYATGSVSAGEKNAGGLSGYGYNRTTIKNSIALNPSVITSSAANRIVARVLGTEKATLENNYADENMIVSKEGVTKEDPNNEKGLGVSSDQLKDQMVYEEKLGWDFNNVWVWDEQAERPLLINNLEEIDDDDNSEKPPLEKNDEGFYIITSIKDLNVINNYPNKNYILQNDLDFEEKSIQPLASDIPFFGTFDGNGKKLYNFSSSFGGLFHINGGTIKNIGIKDADVTGEKGAPQTGILVNLNSGTIENSFSTGKVIGDNTVGGLVGYSNQVIRNSYSTADVTANAKQAGGLVGITNTGSLTENVYATGTVEALEKNAGGLTGYGYNGTVVKNSIALNPSVTTPISANRVVGKVLHKHKATLVNNFAFEEMIVDIEGVTTESPSNEKGMGVDKSEMEDSSTYSDTLGWDFDSIWTWDEEEKRPVLQLVTED